MEQQERIRLLERIVGGLVQLEDEDGGRSFPSKELIAEAKYAMSPESNPAPDQLGEPTDDR